MARVQVALRIRPMSAAELAEGARPIAHRMDEQVVVLQDPTEDPDDVLRASRSREKSYLFDVAFDSTATQETVYRATTQGLVAGVVSSYNATVFAYGPTGCGKTYTMLGTDTEPGICARTLSDLFQNIEDTSNDMEYEVTMSYLEIYNEMVRDLLNPSQGCLQLREDSGGAVRVAGITEVSAISAEEVLQLLARGNRQRMQEPTAANRTSSRSHAVLQVTVCQRCQGRGLRCGRLFMIDLAGSERAAQTQNRGQRMKEGAHINRSLLALGNCIKALSHQASTKYINYRDSKLTRLLKDSLGGNSRTVMIAHISPASTAFEESRSTLAYAHRAKSIRTMAEQSWNNRQSQQHVRQLEGSPQRWSSSEEQQEVLALLCRLCQLQLEAAETHSCTLLKGGLQHPPVSTVQRFNWHRALCACIIQQQRQLITDHRLSVPRPLEELYEIYLQEVAGGPEVTSALEGTSLAKVLQAGGTESLPDSDQDSMGTQSCEHPTSPQQGPHRDSLPPLCPTGNSTPAPMFKKTLQAQQLGSTVVPTPPLGHGTVTQERTPRARWSTWHDSSAGSGTSSEAAVAVGREYQETSSSTESIMAKATQHWSCIQKSTHLHAPGPVVERGGPGLWQAGSEDSLAGMATHSVGTWLRVHKKGSREPGRREDAMDGRRRSRRSRSIEGSGCESAAPRAPSPWSNALQSRSKHGVQAASTQQPPRALPRAQSLYSQLQGAGVPSLPVPLQLPTTTWKGQCPRLSCITRKGARASGKDGRSHWYRAENLSREGLDPVPSQRAEHPSCQHPPC